MNICYFCYFHGEKCYYPAVIPKFLNTSYMKICDKQSVLWRIVVVLCINMHTYTFDVQVTYNNINMLYEVY